MTSGSKQSSIKPPKPKVGDIVVFVEPTQNGPRVPYCLRAEPLEVLHDLQELSNPKLDIQDPTYFDVPTDPGCWVVIKEKDLFTQRGYLIRMVKISNIVTGSSGWTSEKSVRFPTENDILSSDSGNEEDEG